MIPPSFEFHAPRSVEDAIGLLGQYGEEAKLLAGGHSLLPMMKLRFVEPTHLIDINSVAELRGIREEDGMIAIGAMTSESDLIRSDLLAKRCPLIPEAARLIGDPQVRNRGTIGGDIAHGDPGNDHPAVMMAVGAIFKLQGPNGVRELPANGFYLGTYYTQLEADEILTKISVPAFSANTGYSYQKLKRKTGDFAIAAAAVVLELSGDLCQHISIALTNVGPTALKAEGAENLLNGKKIDDALIEDAAHKVMEICQPADDLRGDAQYKTYVAAEMTRRAIRQALNRAKGN